MTPNRPLLLTLATVGLLLPASAPAAVVVVAPTTGTNGSFSITQDITFTLTSASNSGAMYFVLDEWVASTDGSSTTSSFSNLAFTKNGGGTLTASGSFLDNATSGFGNLTQKDGDFAVSPGPSLAIGDTITVKTGTYTLAAVANFNPQATQTFTGSMFLADSTGIKVSNTVLVPEPGSAALFLGATALLGLRRRSFLVP